MLVSFRSPLKRGSLVETEDGYTLRILAPPRSTNKGYYNVLVRVLNAGWKFQHLVGQVKLWSHHSRDRFRNSRIKAIDGRALCRGSTLEEEFFSNGSISPSQV